MSHFWEGPSFNATFMRSGITSAEQQYVFQRTIMDSLGPGDGTPDFPGLLQYIGPGKEFGPETHVRASIITPTSRQASNELRYPDMIHQIIENVTRMFGGDLDTDPSGSMAEPITYLDYFPRSSKKDQESTAAGKAIFQYDPVQARCIDPNSRQPTQVAAQQLWFEVNPRPFLWHYWVALPEQFVPPTPRPGTGSKRRGLPSNETTNEQHHIHLDKREEAWIPGVQPSVYPACLAAIENNGSIPETTAALVGPSGPISVSQSSFPSSSASSSAVASRNTLCAAKCSSCGNLPSLTSPSKRYLQGGKARKSKRVLDGPQNAPWRGNTNEFMSFQWKNKDIKILDLGSTDDDDEAPPSTSEFLPLEDSQVNFGVTGLCGCTSLVVASTQGVWISHFWEDPSFDDSDDHPYITEEQQQEIFKREVLDVLGPGDGTPEFEGLSQYIGQGKPFGPNTYVQAVVITPGEKQQNNMPDNVMYANMVQDIVITVTRLFGGDFPNDDPGTMGTAVDVIDYLPQRDLEDVKEFTPFGKALFQYDPVEARCIDTSTGQMTQFAMLRLWLENRSQSYLDHYWKAWPEQDVPATPTQENPGSKPRGLSSNDTMVERGNLFPAEKRQEPWAAGVQPSVYPACFAAIENTGTGFPEPTAVPVGPGGAVKAPRIIYTETVAATAGSGTVLYGCTATTVDHDTAACTGSMTPLTTLFPTTTTTTTTTTSISTTATTTNTVLPLLGLPSECMNQDTFTSYDSCVSSCAAGHCEEYHEKKKKKKKRVLCEAVGDCGPLGAQPAWRCFC